MKPQPLESSPPIAAAVIIQAARVLLVRRRLSEGSLLWQFPAGAIENGETAEDAAVRETAEEVGLVVRAARRLGERIHPATGRTMIYVNCEPVSGSAFVADTDELDEVAWSTLAELAEYVPHGLYPPVQDYLDRMLSAVRR